MTTMAMLKEHHGPTIVDQVDGLRDGTPPENLISGARSKDGDGNQMSLSSELAALASMSYSDLRLAWRRHCRSAPAQKDQPRPSGAGDRVEDPGECNRWSEHYCKRQLVELARIMATKSGLAKPRAVALKPGARLLRSWAGVTHDVLVVEDGFLWAGKTWASLSAIAREITGTRWSGPRFFGLNARAEPDTSDPPSKGSDHA